LVKLAAIGKGGWPAIMRRGSKFGLLRDQNELSEKEEKNQTK
jgi:hypothetical protein